MENEIACDLILVIDGYGLKKSVGPSHQRDQEHLNAPRRVKVEAPHDREIRPAPTNIGTST